MARSSLRDVKDYGQFTRRAKYFLTFTWSSIKLYFVNIYILGRIHVSRQHESVCARAIVTCSLHEEQNTSCSTQILLKKIS